MTEANKVLTESPDELAGIRLMTPAERKVFDDFSTWGSLRLEIVRYDKDSDPVVIGIIDDSSADIIISFSNYLDPSIEGAVNLFKILDDSHQDLYWVEGGLALLDDELEYEDLRNEEITEDA
jgi:hypothetical protein